MISLLIFLAGLMCGVPCGMFLIIILDEKMGILRDDIGDNPRMIPPCHKCRHNGVVIK